MAARSPNVRLRKAPNRKSPSLKCPLTAPAKSSKPRVSRLALISSISHKIVDAKDKAKPFPSKITATIPNVKAKQPSTVAKALTTPRIRKPISNPDTFRSVRNPKPKNVAVPKNKTSEGGTVDILETRNKDGIAFKSIASIPGGNHSRPKI
ncbi:hypothetical protein RchiOBHm_Chr6g0246631 [Rosa chinensis]|uniref:Uncharacterized protein n=1 Tax=Rosa chinensis TaxID=74649 RepID=A0A2P6PJK7_ROSCH|nr:uncharacterized protein LOC112174076 [Rosa chinensis]PRQ22108.1 hypothetical protein RchiOBHm_Chr6g0246631 [Rosa chinensis]